MKRAAAVVLVAVAASGCFVSLGGPLSMLGGDRPLDEKTLEGEGRAKILLVDLSGVITDQPERHAFGLVEEESTLARVKSTLEKAKDDSRVKALLLRINSPGGGVTASDEIYNEILRFKREENVPVVASLGDVAASGGYYVACAADTIVAHPTTVTGSIGVIMMNLNLEGLLGKIGVKNQTFKAGEHKDILSPLRPVTPEERRIVQGILDSMHKRFIGVVTDSRAAKLEQTRLAELTDGRIFDANQALEAGLVDEVGTLAQAIETTKKKAGLKEARVVTYERHGEMHENIYSRTRGMPAQINVLPVDIGALTGSGARFMYLWSPGVVE